MITILSAVASILGSRFRRRACLELELIALRHQVSGRPVSVGIHGRLGQRNTPTVLNALYNKHQFWDGRVTTLEQQAALPITNPFEMGSASIGDAVSRIASDKDYQTRFMQAFGRRVNL
jgi:cytochrome c peroxidase